MKVAVIGSGISGLVAAHHLHREHDITVFEAARHVGGHTHTVDVDLDGREYAIDTGFIVYNELNYPVFSALLAELGVATQASDMSFSVRREDTGFEYRGGGGSVLGGLLVQKRNALRPGFWRMLRGIEHFHREARALIEQDPGTAANGETLAEFLQRGAFPRETVEQYVVPMGASIWSSSRENLARFPARFFVEFLDNHRMLQVRGRPQWRVVQGGSARYVEALTRPFAERILTETPVLQIRRSSEAGRPGRRGIELTLPRGERRSFDRVVVATHSDQALKLLADADPAEREILGALPYQANSAVLHTDTRLLPRRRRAWAAWNYHLCPEREEPVAITYNMNILQGLGPEVPYTFLVSLNRDDAIDRSKVLREIAFEHPLYTVAGAAAQQRRLEIQGRRGTYFAGAYWGHGFHEDGAASGLEVVQRFRADHAEAAA